MSDPTNTTTTNNHKSTAQIATQHSLKTNAIPMKDKAPTTTLSTLLTPTTLVTLQTSRTMKPSYDAIVKSTKVLADLSTVPNSEQHKQGIGVYIPAP